MRSVLLIGCVILGAAAIAGCEHGGPATTVPPNAAATGAMPQTIRFPGGRNGVVFQHEKHVDRAKGDCSVCHDKLFPQSVKAALNYGSRRHRTAENKKLACAFCHIRGGASFASEGNCARCHGDGERQSAKRPERRS